MTDAATFEAIYEKPDPWGVSSYRRRDRPLAALLGPLVRGKVVLELGCGEGHLTRVAFGEAAKVVGMDISATAISRAPRLPNAVFEVGDMRTVRLSGFDVIADIECACYLSAEERMEWFARVSRQHRGIFVMMSAICGGKYFTHSEVMASFERVGIKILGWHNIYVTRPPTAGLWAAVASRLPGVATIAEKMPAHLVCHRAYVGECAA